MIPFGSQRKNGQDLATHLLNEHDNEVMRVVDVRGAVADDLHGAFAEWEVQAKALTKCQNYLYSLSINPDPEQGRLTQEQYQDYIARVESELGLEGQPRAIVMHEKEGREHAHVVWSRIDAEAGKAIQMPFDREKLMMVTRQFARDHDLKLPDGYKRDRQDNRNLGHDQLSLYEKAQQEKVGVTKEERARHVTEAWVGSDSPKAFVQALEERGYILATGKRPYVLIDIYGEMNALPKLITDKTIRTKDIKAFLEGDYPTDSLPSVEEARKLAEQHRKAREAFIKAQRSQSKIEELKQSQAERRIKVLDQIAAQKGKQVKDKIDLVMQQKEELNAFKQSYSEKRQQIEQGRENKKTEGLASIFGKLSGASIIVKQWYNLKDYVDDKRHKRAVMHMNDRHDREADSLLKQHEMQDKALQRKIRALDRLDAREQRSLAVKQLRDERLREQQGFVHLPTIGRRKSLEKAKDDDRYVDLEEDFTKAAGGTTEGGDSSSDSGSSERNFRDVFSRKDDKSAKKADKDKPFEK